MRSPAGQPAWARPALLAIAAVAGWSYAWQSARPVDIEIYYAAAVRSMSMSLRNFVFGAFDPAATISTDKLPGAFWVQALSLRIFAVHTWALVLPQVIEGTLTVLVLYRAVRRLAGPAAGLIAATILAVSPATVALNRGNVSDTLMILLVVLAADSVVVAITSGRRRPALAAGLWVGLAFQAKMLEAWLVLPALAACYLCAAGGSWLVRIRQTAALCAIAVGVSLSWMTAVTLWPASLRPYVDGSQHNSVFEQVFVYNGFGRLDEAAPDQLLDRSVRLGIPASPPAAWDRLLTGGLGRDTGWLLAAALVAVIAGLAARGRRPRTDPVRACIVLWTIWLVVLAASFSTTTTINSYYTAALSPAVAALLGTGLVLAWHHRGARWSRTAVGIAVLAAAGYAWWLLPAAGTGLPPWLRPLLLGLGLAAIVGLVAAELRPAVRALPLAALTLSALSVLVVPAVASGSVALTGLGPFQEPFASARTTADTTQFFEAGFQAAEILPALEAANRGTPYLMAIQTAALAAPFIWASGREIVPIGGFTGTIPEPTLSAIQGMIEQNQVHLFIQAPHTHDARLEWIARRCLPVTERTGPPAILPVSVYYCPSFMFLPKGFH